MNVNSTFTFYIIFFEYFFVNPENVVMKSNDSPFEKVLINPFVIVFYKILIN
jgi:hypothetical protein